MKYIPVLFLLLTSGLSPAQTPPVIWPMPSPLPRPPAGVPETAYPLPKLDWFERVNGNIRDAHRESGAIQLIFDGDSITDGWRTKGAQVWDARYRKFGAFDFGISGDRTQHVLWRLAQGQADGLKPKLVVLMIGTNNIFSNTPEEIFQGVKAIVQEYRDRCPAAVILVQAIFPRGQDPKDNIRAKIRETNKLIGSLGDGDKVVYIDFADKFLEPDGSLSAKIMPDFLHPSPAGYEIWANAIQAVLDRYLAVSDGEIERADRTSH